MRQSLPSDLIRRNFFALVPYQRLMADIIVLPCLEGRIYLNSIADLFNGEILAYHYSLKVDTALCIDTLEKLAKAIDTRGAILHSDGGSTYIVLCLSNQSSRVGS